jgi:hypothetical protein
MVVLQDHVLVRHVERCGPVHSDVDSLERLIHHVGVAEIAAEGCFTLLRFQRGPWQVGKAKRALGWPVVQPLAPQPDPAPG